MTTKQALLAEFDRLVIDGKIGLDPGSFPTYASFSEFVSAAFDRVEAEAKREERDRVWVKASFLLEEFNYLGDYSNPQTIIIEAGAAEAKADGHDLSAPPTSR
jgi:hypothetical protein